MSPLLDLLDISRQTTVLTFVFVDGFSNMIIPTNGRLIAMLVIRRISYGKWIRFVLPLFWILIILAIITIILTVRIEYNWHIIYFCKFHVKLSNIEYNRTKRILRH